jgi:ubiquinone/menaquinone biosynthesis C-methylase UbiE
VNSCAPREEYPFLCVDEYLKTLIDARALASALELGLIDNLLEGGPMTRSALAEGLGMEPRGFDLLLGLLSANQVLVHAGAEISLTPAFVQALQFRDLLETRIAFAAAVLTDCHDLFTELLARPGEFMARAEVFEMFRYDLAMEETAENYQATARWMRFTTGLTRYEAQACLAHYDFAGHRRMLDIGGNSGEFALRVCKAQPSLEAWVFDLPVVCAVGRDHVKHEPEGLRITFQKGDVRSDVLPEGFDLISFKSFLHDWPEDEVDTILARAAAVSPPGGSLLIFERAPIEAPETALPYAIIPGLLFLHFYREAEFYTQRLAALGLKDINVQRIDLEMPFHLITAKAPL